MKKLILLLLITGFALTSCQKDDLSTVTETESAEGRGKIENGKAKESETEHEEYSEHCGCEESEGCETAFGRICVCDELNSCFSEFGFNRWGWSVKLERPEGGDRTETFGLYAGAGQCDLDKGTEVGSVKVTFYANGTVDYHDFDMSDGFDVKEFHFYAGDTPTPINKNNGKPTVAPGQYYNDGDLDNSEGTLGEPDGIVYVIVHAVVCGDYED